MMDYEIACDGAMSPEVRESHAGRRLAEESMVWDWAQTVPLEFHEINYVIQVEDRPRRFLVD